MKLFVSALILLATSAAASAAFGQNQAGAGSAVMEGLGVGNAPGVLASPQQMEKQWMQSQAQMGVILGPQSQAGCPVVLTSARLNWPASYLPVTSAEKITEPNLALGFLNPSGKAIRSATITARFLGKQSVYHLDADAFDLRLTLSGVDAADKAAKQLREIRLPEKMFAYGVTRVSLEQVTFADGTFWMAGMGHGNCSLSVKGNAERVAK
jgi:hypothetical protein